MTLPYYAIEDSPRVGRRSFLTMTGSLAAAALWSSRATGAVRTTAKLADYPFQLGVASGDPTADGMVLWTRLAPKPLEGGGMPAEPVEVAWQVAEDEQMSKVVREGTTTANPGWANSVHVEVDGLKPERWYWYQFKAAGEVSPKGRTRTMPAAGSLPQGLKFAFASCQHFETGFYTAYEYMAREDLDLVIHLGDYIYEGGPRDRGVRKHVGGKLDSLEDYRTRHAQYRGDAALQAMHAAAPWLVTWDDHEVENNYAGDTPDDVRRATDQFLAMRARAYKAYYEHMPLRRSSLPEGPAMPLYRKISVGSLADFYVLDTRQYRTDQPCDDRLGPPCPATMDPAGTILGKEQREWLFSGLTSSPAKWNVMANQVMVARVDLTPGEKVGYSPDKWSGYEVERRQLLKHLHEHKVSNPVVLTGDIHTNWANELIADFDDLDSAVVGAEFVGTSISSSGDGQREAKNQAAVLSENPFVKFHNMERGYVACQVTPSQWKTEFKTLEYVTRPGSPLNVRATYVLEDGSPTLKQA